MADKPKNFKPFVVGEVVKTRDGRSARIICVDKSGSPYPVVVLLRDHSGRESVESYTEDGRF